MDIALAERVEMDALASSTLHAPAPIASALGIHLLLDNSALMCLATAADVLALNRIVGLGVEVPATREQLARMIDAARQRGTRRLFVQIAPASNPPDIERWIEAEGGTKHNRWVRLWRAVENIPEATTDLEVRQLTENDALRSGEIVAAAFGMPIDLAPWIAATVGKPGWTHYGAFDGSKLVASTALFISGKIGWLGFAATDEYSRGRGAQGALIKRRMEHARDAGCDSVVVETAEQTPEHSALSYRNMLRFGFTEAYTRQNYTISFTR